MPRLHLLIIVLCFFLFGLNGLAVLSALWLSYMFIQNKLAGWIVCLLVLSVATELFVVFNYGPLL